MAAKLKTIEPNDLEWVEKNKCQITVEDVNRMKKERFQDTLVRLLSSESALQELQQFVVLASECLAVDRVYPVPAELMSQGLCEQSDLQDAHRAMQVIVSGSSVIYKRAFILAALAFSPRFLRQFCPPPSSVRSSHFLVNADLMQKFIGARDQKTPRAPLQVKIAHVCTGNSTIADFNVECFRAWCSGLESGYRPWTDAHKWRKTDPNAIGAELHTRLALQEKRQSSHLALEAGPSQTQLEWYPEDINHNNNNNEDND